MTPTIPSDAPRALSPRVLILGAHGRFGAAAVRAFQAAGWQVLAQVRRAADTVPPGVQALPIPLADTAGLAIAAAGVRTVVHAINPLYTDWAAQVLPLGRLGMDLAQRLGATFLLPGNVYGFGHPMPPVLDEDTPCRPTTRKGRIRQALEDEMAARAAQGLRSVVVRAGDFFGGGRGNWFDRAIVASLARGKLTYPGPRDLPHAWAFLPDLARAVVAVAARDDLPMHSVLHFAGHTLTGDELLDAVEAALARRGALPAGGLRRQGMPWGVIRLGGLVVPMWRELAEMAYLWHEAHRLDGRRLASVVGPLPTTPLAQAVDAALDALDIAALPPQAQLAPR